jgi:hypothetical protein
MNELARKSFQLLAVSIGLCTLSACGWVDSTGAQVAEFSTPSELLTTQPLTITENSTVIAELMGEGSSLRNWTWTPDNKNEIYRCDGINGFDINHAVTSLSEACTSQTDCSIVINESESMSGTQFTITMPELKSPLAMSYSFTTTGDDEAIVTRQQLLCAVSINEAPQAADDSYSVQRNSALIVDAGDYNSLLSNDLDDTDFRNTKLKIVSAPVTEPLYAALFNLDAHGGFVYQALADAPVNSSGHVEDSFTYAITDGIHTVNAQVFIKTFDANEKPERLQQIPDVVFSAADGLSDSHVRHVDLSQYFWDPDGDTLTFQSNDFESTDGLTLSTKGILTANASILDVNQWRASVQANDGVDNAQGSFVVTVRVPDSIKLESGNKPPTVTDIKNRSFTEVFTYDVSTFFTDPDSDDQLTFTAQGLPNGIQIRADGYDGLVTDGFNLILN